MHKEVRQIFDDAKKTQNYKTNFANGVFKLIDRNQDKVTDPFEVSEQIQNIRRESAWRKESEHGFIDRVSKYVNETIKTGKQSRKSQTPTLF